MRGRHVPLALVALRVVLAPVVVALAVRGAPGGWIVAALAMALVSDALDGVIARRLGVATEGLRRLDSAADTVFYLGVLGAVVLLHPEVVRIHAVGLGVLLGLEVVRHGVDRWKYGRAASYHMWSAKAWGLALAGGLAALFGWGQTGWPVGLAVWLGVATDLEGLAATAVLSRWHHDVPSLAHAVRLERHSGTASP